MKAIDADGSGQVDFDEFFEWYVDHIDDGPQNNTTQPCMKLVQLPAATLAVTSGTECAHLAVAGLKAFFSTAATGGGTGERECD